MRSTSKCRRPLAISEMGCNFLRNRTMINGSPTSMISPVVKTTVKIDVLRAVSIASMDEAMARRPSGRPFPGFDNDPELRADSSMLREYGGLLRGDPGSFEFLADSLRYAARLKVLPRPVEIRS